MKLLLSWLSGTSMASWAMHQQPPRAKVYENDISQKFNPTQAYISQPVSEGVEFKVRDHEDQVHGISDGMFWYESVKDDGLVELYIHSREKLDREEQETYRFKIDLYDSQGQIVSPAPVWYAEFRVLDKNDNAPTIDQSSKVHMMQENAKPGSNLPINANKLNKENGKLVIVDADKEGTDSMDFDVEVTEITFMDRKGNPTVLDDLDYFAFQDTSDRMKKQIVYNRKIPDISNYNLAVLTLTVSDCAKGCPQTGGNSLKTEDIKITINILDVNTHAPVLKEVSLSTHFSSQLCIINNLAR